MAILAIQTLPGNAFWIRQLVSFFYLNALWVALSASGTRQIWRYVLLGLWAVSTAMHNIDIQGHDQSRMLIANALGIAFLAFCITGIVRFVLRSERVTADTLYAAATGYLLVALLFGQLHMTVFTVLPDSFAFAASMPLPEGLAVKQAMDYFSFVTLATLGYGDITPVHPLARTLASIEAVVGQFYVAVLVAWLVSRYVNDSQHEKHGNKKHSNKKQDS